MHLLGIDNIFFQIGDLEKAIPFYEKLGFRLKFRIPDASSALFSIGNEEPGLILREAKHAQPSTLWVEIRDAHAVKNECSRLGIPGEWLETTTGFTYEIKDPWGNRLGFADYSKKQELARTPTFPS